MAYRTNSPLLTIPFRPPSSESHRPTLNLSHHTNKIPSSDKADPHGRRRGGATLAQRPVRSYEHPGAPGNSSRWTQFHVRPSFITHQPPGASQGWRGIGFGEKWKGPVQQPWACCRSATHVEWQMSDGPSLYPAFATDVSQRLPNLSIFVFL